MSTIPAEILPPSGAPLPSLEVADVVDPPLPSVVNMTKDVHAAAPAAPVTPSSTASANVSNVALSLVAILVFAMVSARH
ncbi:putative glycerophosphodiester phosphodiesterase [Lupinus albus]|uniref:Putative glycerophosphodiester phosphodiesterase n=1 Tax=Lupinus albus TaxID=3870 RepID=A0A6A4Q6J8_LUPAL|nr:putative glycerophosphodiester phosphodiesterase [Lupinus albus]